MSNIDFIIITTIFMTLLVPMVYIFRVHNTLLVEGKLYAVVRISFHFLAGLGLFGFIISAPNRLFMSLFSSFLLPALHLYWFRFLYFRFIRSVGREPVDCMHNWSTGIGKDRFFVIWFELSSIYGAGCIWGPLIWGTASP
jgi:hypothetical protein